MAEPVLSSQSDQLLACLQCQGASNDCGAFTSATVVNALTGSKIQGEKLADEMEHVVWRGVFPVLRKIPNSATLPWGMADVFRKHGLKARWRFFTKLAYLPQALIDGTILMPIIGEWKPLWAHVMTLIAWDPAKGWGFANTQYAAKETFWLPDAVFQRQWKAMGHLLVEVTGYIAQYE